MLLFCLDKARLKHFFVFAYLRRDRSRPVRTCAVPENMPCPKICRARKYAVPENAAHLKICHARKYATSENM